MKKFAFLFIGLFFVFSFIYSNNNNEYKGKAPKYIFFFVADGMSLPQILATEAFLASDSKNPEVKRLDFSQFPYQGICTTYDAGSLITDSASAGTAFASGNKTLNGIINMDPSKTKKYDTIAELIKKTGKKIGVISSVSIDHATPASFYAKEVSRGNYYEIGLQLVNSNFDYFGGGGFVYETGKNKDKENLYELAKKNGFKVARNKQEFNSLKNGERVLATNEVLADSSAMNYEIDRKDDELSLADFVRKGIEVLDNKNGFFIAVEGGKIDWACHANDAMSAIKDVIAFNEAVKVALDFMKKNPKDTLIVVTGDHETGGMSIGFAGTKYETFFDILKNQKMSYVKFDGVISKMKKEGTLTKIEDIMPAIKENFGLNRDNKDSKLYLNDFEYSLLQDAFKMTMMDKKDRPKDDNTYILYGEYEPLTVTITHLLNRKAGIGWTSYSHTGSPVPVYAIGVGGNLFDGYYDNTDIFFKLKSIAGIK